MHRYIFIVVATSSTFNNRLLPQERWSKPVWEWLPVRASSGCRGTRRFQAHSGKRKRHLSYMNHFFHSSFTSSRLFFIHFFLFHLVFSHFDLNRRSWSPFCFFSFFLGKKKRTSRIWERSASYRDRTASNWLKSFKVGLLYYIRFIHVHILYNF